MESVTRQDLREMADLILGRSKQGQTEMADLILARSKKDQTEMADLILHEMGARFEEVNAHLARINDRLDRQGYMLAGGTKALGGLLEHVVNVDSGYERVLVEVSELRARIAKLEAAA